MPYMHCVPRGSVPHVAPHARQTIATDPKDSSSRVSSGVLIENTSRAADPSAVGGCLLEAGAWFREPATVFFLHSQFVQPTRSGRTEPASDCPLRLPGGAALRWPPQHPRDEPQSAGRSIYLGRV